MVSVSPNSEIQSDAHQVQSTGKESTVFHQLDSLSIFFPMYNEEENVAAMLDAALQVVPRIARKYEIIIINDGSTDHTQLRANNYAKKYDNITVISHKKNKGYGASLRTGFSHAQYEWVFFTDGDQQFDLREIQVFIPYTKTYKAIIGYRENRAEGWSRHLNATIFKLFIDMLFRLHVKDIDCAFKLLKTDVIHSLKLESNGAIITAEFLYKLKKKNIPFKQLPVTHLPRQHGASTGANLGVIMKAMVEFARMYLKMKREMMRVE